MEATAVQHLISQAFPEGDVQVELVGGHYNVTVVCDSFEGKRSVARQQKVYAPLAEAIASGALHAVNIRAVTPAEASAG